MSGIITDNIGRSSGLMKAVSAADSFGSSLLHIREEQSSGTAGGTFTQGAWRTRVLNTVKTNEITGASLGSNQITLPAGTYWIDADTGAHIVEQNGLRLYNTSDSSVALYGEPRFTQAWSVENGGGLTGRFTIAAEKVFEVQHYCSVTNAGDGFGYAITGVSQIEVHADVKIWKVS